jgi:hypothetical protein
LLVLFKAIIIFRYTHKKTQQNKKEHDKNFVNREERGNYNEANCPESCCIIYNITLSVLREKDFLHLSSLIHDVLI